MGIIIDNAGILTTVQDRGRFGYEQYGVPTAGPMDMRAYDIANILVGNDTDEAELEMTLMGPWLRFTEPAVIALTGADMSPLLNDQPMSMYRGILVLAGDVLQLSMAVSGCRSYLAVAGGLDIEPVMNSRATLIKNKLGGYEGRPLKKGDQIEFRQGTGGKSPLGHACDTGVADNLPARWIPAEKAAPGRCVLRVIAGPQDNHFTEEGMRTFLSGTYVVTQDFDRMGYRLEGPAIQHVKDGNIISDGIVTGSIQVPTSGQPIIMTADHQSIGGYAKIATVISVDISAIGQCKAGAAIGFTLVGIEEAHQLYLDYQREMDELRQKMRRSVDYEPPRFFQVSVSGRTFSLKVEEHD